VALEKPTYKERSASVAQLQPDTPATGQARMPDPGTLGRWNRAIARNPHDEAGEAAPPGTPTSAASGHIQPSTTTDLANAKAQARMTHAAGAEKNGHATNQVRTSQNPLPTRRWPFPAGQAWEPSRFVGADARQAKTDVARSPVLVPDSTAVTGGPGNEAGLVLPLGALRSRHAGNRHDSSAQGVSGASSADGSVSAIVADSGGVAGLQKVGLVSTAFQAEVASPDAQNAGTSAERLHALIESCCDRVWVSDTTIRSTRAVMLDLGRWMSGCTVEVARQGGVLKVTMRGVDGGQRQSLEGALSELGDVLADRLGCRVVTSVATDQEST